jgi:hypothetical protein
MVGKPLQYKAGGSVIAFSSIEIAKNLTTTYSTSILNNFSQKILVGGNLNKALGSTTYSNTAPTGELILNGTSAQNINTGDPLTITNLTMQHQCNG